MIRDEKVAEVWKKGIRKLTNNNKINNICPMQVFKEQLQCCCWRWWWDHWHCHHQPNRSQKEMCNCKIHLIWSVMMAIIHRRYKNTTRKYRNHWQWTERSLWLFLSLQPINPPKWSGGSENNRQNFCIWKNRKTCLPGLIPWGDFPLHWSDCDWAQSQPLLNYTAEYVLLILMQTLADCGLPNGKGDSIEHSAFTFEVPFDFPDHEIEDGKVGSS